MGKVHFGVAWCGVCVFLAFVCCTECLANEQFRWDPVSNVDGNLVVLFPASIKLDEVRSITLRTAAGKVFQPTRVYHYSSNQNRLRARFPKPGKDFGGNIKVTITTSRGILTWKIANGAQRWELGIDAAARGPATGGPPPAGQDGQSAATTPGASNRPAPGATATTPAPAPVPTAPTPSPADTNGTQPDSSTTAAAGSFQEKGGIVSMEAESFASQTGYRKFQDGSASRGAVMRVVQSRGSLDFSFSIRQAGTWYLWIRTNATIPENNGLFLELDGEPLRAPSSHPMAGARDVYLRKGGWSWQPEWSRGGGHAGPITVQMSQGTHRLSIIKRKMEDPLIDKIVLTRTAQAPAGLGPAETRATVAPVAALVDEDVPMDDLLR